MEIITQELKKKKEDLNFFETKLDTKSEEVLMTELAMQEFAVNPKRSSKLKAELKEELKGLDKRINAKRLIAQSLESPKRKKK